MIGRCPHYPRPFQNTYYAVLGVPPKTDVKLCLIVNNSAAHLTTVSTFGRLVCCDILQMG